jgi:hypothetical protein
MKRLEEMAKADIENIDMSQDPGQIAKEYIKNYKERTGKDFTKQAVSALKRLLNKEGHDNAEEIVSAAREQAGIESGGKKQSKEEKDEKMRQAVKGAAKRAHDAYQESFRDKVKKYL